MLIILTYYVSLSILQILYVTGISVSWNSPSISYSSISSKSVPIYNGNVQQESSTIKPFRVSGSTSTSLNQIGNLDTEMSFNRGLGMNTNKIIVSKKGQLKDNKGDGVSEYTITNIQPSELSNESSQSSKISNFNIPVQMNGPRLSTIYHGTNKISETGRINDVSNLYKSNNDADIGLDTTFGSIQFDGINNGKTSGSGREEENNKGFSGSKGSISFNSKTKGRRGRPSEEEDGDRSNESRKFVEQNYGRVEGYGGEESGGSGSIGLIGFGRKNEGEPGGSDVEEGENKGFSGSKGSISFNSKYKGKRGRPSGEKEDGGRRFSGSNESIKFVEQNDGRVEGYGGEESGGSGLIGLIGFGRKNEGGLGGSGVGFSGSKGSISFGSRSNGRADGYSGEESEGSGSGGFIGYGRKNEGWAGGSVGEEKGNIEFNGLKGSIRFGSKGNGRAGEYGGEESGGSGSIGLIGFGRKNEGESDGSDVEEGENKGFSGSKGSIRFGSKGNSRAGGYKEEERGKSGSGGFIEFGRKNDGGASGSGGEEKGNKGFSGSKGSIKFGSKGNGRTGGFGGEVKGGIRFNGPNVSIRFDGKNEGEIGGFGEKNIKISGGHRANRSSRSRNIGGKRNFKLSTGGIQLGAENGEISRSNSILSKITGKNYGSRRFGGNSKSDKFVGDSGMSEVGGSKLFGEKMNKFSETGGIYEDRNFDDYNENRSVKEYGTSEVRFGEYSSLGNSGN
ncbi:uncharacterized PE-PGRS family protein PE_PGRS20-like isoform X1 [Aphis gossypii]|uniref:uncharacterized PE-PGRS family protein PE_PGRS20-like isoform X1 n=1 Tax=Aphis gossypii TaxID=80765 RepID=UPI0021594324|nr:uncharacterized PE-PGRS family protein PE_PGRS20-like isoform X1 [Aphis gossypii]